MTFYLKQNNKNTRSNSFYRFRKNIRHSFLEIYLKNLRFFFNFGESIKNDFQKGAETSILQNGFISECFLLKRGCRQGDQMSPYIFLLCSEVLEQMLRKISILRDYNKEMKISQYADDTQILLDGTEQSLRESLQILSKFYKLAGLKINEKKKTRAIWIGAKSNSNNKLCEDYK